jgi:hypothetical protein
MQAVCTAQTGAITERDCHPIRSCKSLVIYSVLSKNLPEGHGARMGRKESLPWTLPVCLPTLPKTLDQVALSIRSCVRHFLILNLVAYYLDYSSCNFQSSVFFFSLGYQSTRGGNQDRKPAEGLGFGMETIRQLCYGIGIGIASAWSQQVRAHCHSSVFPLCLMPRSRTRPASC